MDEKIKIPKKKMEEFRDRMMNYSTWRWSGVSLYQSIFIVFLTSAIIIFVDLISQGDPVFKIVTLVLLILISFELYRRMIIQASKPIFVAENMIATLEDKPVNVKDKDGKVYSVMKISSVLHNNDSEVKK